MTDFVIPCDTFVRLTNILYGMPEDISEWFKTVRIDNGIAVATNRRILAAENVGGPAGIIHVIADQALINQCRTEAAFSSALTITVNEVLKFAVAKTTLGYVHPGNCVRFSDDPNDFDRWRTVVEQCKTPASAPRGGMFWDADMIARLAAASPSGRVVFEEIIDATGRPTIIRDINEYNWIGVFQPFSTEESYSPATLPTWIG
jgi:hypothetical protein